LGYPLGHTMSSSCVDLSGRMRLLHAMSGEAADEAMMGD